jgi:hypothetical protein
MKHDRPRRFQMLLSQREAERLEQLAKLDGVDKCDVVRRLLNAEAESRGPRLEATA